MRRHHLTLDDRSLASEQKRPEHGFRVDASSILSQTGDWFTRYIRRRVVDTVSLHFPEYVNWNQVIMAGRVVQSMWMITFALLAVIVCIWGTK